MQTDRTTGIKTVALREELSGGQKVASYVLEAQLATRDDGTLTASDSSNQHWTAIGAPRQTIGNLYLHSLAQPEKFSEEAEEEEDREGSYRGSGTAALSVVSSGTVSGTIATMPMVVSKLRVRCLDTVGSGMPGSLSLSL